MSSADAKSTSWIAPWVVGALGSLFVVFVVSSILADNDWNPTTLIKFPAADADAMRYAESLLDDVVPAPNLGHDGKFFFTQAMDPFYIEPEVHAVYLDRPTYRAQRMLYPTLAGGFGLLSPKATAWSMIVLNVLALGVGTGITVLVARELGIAAIYGAAFVVNPGVLVSTLIDTADVFSMLFLVLAFLFVLRNRLIGASLALTAAALSRETMIIAAVGLIAYLLYKRIRVPLSLAYPFLGVGGWWVFLRMRLGGLTDAIQDTDALDSPFRGFVKALGGWFGGPIDWPHLVMGVVLMMVALLTVWRTFRNPSPLGAMVVAFAALAFVMSEPVWRNYFDSSRALAPLITAYVLMVPASFQGGPRSGVTTHSNAGL